MKGRVGQLWQRTRFSAEPPSRNGSYIKFMSGREAGTLSKGEWRQTLTKLT